VRGHKTAPTAGGPQDFADSVVGVPVRPQVTKNKWVELERKPLVPD